MQVQAITSHEEMMQGGLCLIQEPILDYRKCTRLKDMILMRDTLLWIEKVLSLP